MAQFGSESHGQHHRCRTDRDAVPAKVQNIGVSGLWLVSIV